MLKPLFQFEEGLLRVEKWILVGCVLLMLALAGYTVFYRNVLISVQNHLATSGPPVAEQAEQKEPAGVVEPGDEPAEADDEGFGGGFGGGFGDTAEEPVEEDDGAGGFGGGFGGGFDDDEADDEAEPVEEENEADDANGFGGGFGDAQGDSDEVATEDASPEDDADGFGGGFGGGFGDGEEADQPEAGQPMDNEPIDDQQADDQPAASEPAASEPVGGPPPEGSFAARVIEIIDDVKFHWLDVLLRQLVIICGFLGAMLATRQRSHITVDAVGKLLKGRTEHIVHTITSLAAGVVCVFLAMSGWDLVEIGRQFPRQVIPWLKDWQFQLAFPVGWGLLAFHFLMRTIESATLAVENSEAPKPGAEPHEEAL